MQYIKEGIINNEEKRKINGETNEEW